MEILPRSKKSAIIGIIIVYIVWAIAVPITKILLVDIPPFTLLFIRFSLAAFVLTPIFLIDDLSHPVKLKNIPKISLLAFLGPFMSNALFYIGIRSTTALDASVISASFPVVMMIAAGVFLKEKSTFSAWIGAFIAFVGTLSIIGEPILRGNGGISIQALQGNLIIASSVLTWTGFVLLGKIIAKDFSTLTLTALYMILSAIFSIPLLLFEIKSTHLDFIQNLNTWTWFNLLFLIIGASVVAYLILAWSFGKVSAQLAGYLSFIQPSVAVIASFLILGEIPSQYFYFGSALVAIGIFLIFRKGFSAPRRIIRPDTTV